MIVPCSLLNILSFENDVKDWNVPHNFVVGVNVRTTRL